jgi:hypothetical protein
VDTNGEIQAWHCVFIPDFSPNWRSMHLAGHSTGCPLDPRCLWIFTVKTNPSLPFLSVFFFHINIWYHYPLRDPGQKLGSHLIDSFSPSFSVFNLLPCPINLSTKHLTYVPTLFHSWYFYLGLLPSFKKFV